MKLNSVRGAGDEMEHGARPRSGFPHRITDPCSNFALYPGQPKQMSEVFNFCRILLDSCSAALLEFWPLK